MAWTRRKPRITYYFARFVKLALQLVGKEYYLTICTILDIHFPWNWVCSLCMQMKLISFFFFYLFFLVLRRWLWISSWCRISRWVETIFYQNLYVILYCERVCCNVVCHINYARLQPKVSLFCYAIVHHMTNLFNLGLNAVLSDQVIFSF